MPGPVLLAELVTRVRRRSNQENSSFVTDAEIEEYLEEHMGALFDIIIESAGPHHYVATSATKSTIANQEWYQLSTEPTQIPFPIYKVIGVDVLWNNEWRKVTRLHPADWNKYEDVSGWTHWSDVRYHWATVVSSSDPSHYEDIFSSQRELRFAPTPTAVHSYRIRYIPFPQDWSSDFPATFFQGFSGWDYYAVLMAAADVCEKEDSFGKADRYRAQAEKRAEQIRWHASTMNEDDQLGVRDLDEERNLASPRRALS